MQDDALPSPNLPDQGNEALANPQDAPSTGLHALPPWLKANLELVRLRLDASMELHGENSALQFLADRLWVPEDTANALARVNPTHLTYFPEHEIQAGLYALQWLPLDHWPAARAEWREYAAVLHAFLEDVFTLAQHFEDLDPLVQPGGLCATAWHRLAQGGWAHAQQSWQAWQSDDEGLACCAQVAWAMRCYLAGQSYGTAPPDTDSSPTPGHIHILPEWASPMLGWPLEDWLRVQARWRGTQNLEIALPAEIWARLKDTAHSWAQGR